MANIAIRRCRIRKGNKPPLLKETNMGCGGFMSARQATHEIIPAIWWQ